MKIVQSWLLNKQAVANTKGAIGGGDGPTFVYNGVPFHAQKHVNMCGDACAKMVLEWKGTPNAINLDTNPRGVVQGVGADKLAQRFGLGEDFFPGQLNGSGKKWTKGAINDQAIKDALKKHGPVICFGEFCRMMGTYVGHYVLVYGIDKGLVVFHDPWHGEGRRKSVDWFVEKLGSAYIEKQKKWAENPKWGRFPGYLYFHAR